MSDYFRFYCDGLDEPRLLYAIHQCPHVPVIWLWVLCECARTKRNQIEQPSNSMLVGLQHKLNVPPGSVQLSLKLLSEIEYLTEQAGFYIVRKWNDLQSKYMQEKAWKQTHRNQKKPKETKNPIGEERRGEEKREDKKEKTEEATKKFVVPEPEEVSEYAKSIGFNLLGQKFCDFYETRGWMVGKSRMKDWRAAVRTWKTRQAEEGVPTRSDKKASDDQKRANRDRMIADYQKQIVSMTRDEADRFMLKVHDTMKDVVAENQVMDYWLRANGG